MKDEYLVVVAQGISKENIISFVFTQLCDALEFMGTCLECGKNGTVVRISRIEED